MKAAAILVLTWVIAFSPVGAFPLSLDEALYLAKETFPVMKASHYKVESSQALYKASLSPYLPSLDASTSQEQHWASKKDYDLSTYDLNLSYTLFDGGKRKAARDIARSNLDLSNDDLGKTALDLEFDVKTAYFGTIARKDVLEERRLQLKNAEKDYEIAQGRHRLGVAKLSDVLQASVRLEQARFNIVEAEGALTKVLSELNSLIGRPLDTPYDLTATLDFKIYLPPRTILENYALERPEIRAAESSIRIAKSNVSLQTSPFFPTISAAGSYTRTDGSLVSVLNERDSSAGLYATWNLFELDKFYRRKSAQMDVKVSEENLNETVRQILLNLSKSYDDFLTASRNVVVAEEQRKTAEQNYSQALGEYRVGKGDILSLITAESALARAREQLIVARYGLIQAKASVERNAGVEKLETLDATQDPGTMKGSD